MGLVTAYETAGGCRYRVRYRKPDRSQTDKRGFRTKRDAELFLTATEVRKATGEFVDAAASRITVSELGGLWRGSSAHLKPNSTAVIQDAWRVHVRSTSMVSELTSVKSSTVVIRAYDVLAGITDVAVKDRRLSSNPASGVNLPKKHGK